MTALYVLVVAVTVGTGPMQLATSPFTFDTAADCRQAASLAISLIASNSKAFCFDAISGEKIGEAMRGFAK